MKRSLPLDPSFESLLRNTQALAKSIQQSHEQQQGPISPMYLPQQTQQPPQQQSLGANFLQQQQQLLMQQQQQNYYNQSFEQLQNDLRSNLVTDSQLRSVSLDSDLAFDGIEDLLIDSIIDGQDSKVHSAAAYAQPQNPYKFLKS